MLSLFVGAITMGMTEEMDKMASDGADAKKDAKLSGAVSKMGRLAADMAREKAHEQFIAREGSVLDAIGAADGVPGAAGFGGGGGGAPARERRDCGYPGITEAECVQRAGCAPACKHVGPCAARSPRACHYYHHHHHHHPRAQGRRACEAHACRPRCRACQEVVERLLPTLARFFTPARDRCSQASGTRRSSTCHGATSESARRPQPQPLVHAARLAFTVLPLPPLCEDSPSFV